MAYDRVGRMPGRVRTDDREVNAMQPLPNQVAPAWEPVLKKLRAILSRLLACWDICLFGAMVAAIAGLLVAMLWPRPQYELTLERLPGPEPAFSAAPAPSETPAQPARPKVASRAHRKAPVKPPVLNLNTATAAQLDLLPGIGPALARRIVDYRRHAGRFATVEQVMEVSGIGPKKFDKMKPYLKL